VNTATLVYLAGHRLHFPVFSGPILSYALIYGNIGTVEIFSEDLVFIKNEEKNLLLQGIDPPTLHSRGWKSGILTSSQTALYLNCGTFIYLTLKLLSNPTLTLTFWPLFFSVKPPINRASRSDSAPTVRSH